MSSYHYQRRPSSHMERTSLLMSDIDKVLSTHSVATVADDYRLANVLSSDQPPSITPAMMEDQKKSSFAQSIFNSINILLGVGILALPLGFKVHCKKGNSSFSLFELAHRCLLPFMD